jgi:hypothetical protein
METKSTSRAFTRGSIDAFLPSAFGSIERRQSSFFIFHFQDSYDKSRKFWMFPAENNRFYLLSVPELPVFCYKTKSSNKKFKQIAIKNAGKVETLTIHYDNFQENNRWRQQKTNNNVM